MGAPGIVLQVKVEEHEVEMLLDRLKMVLMGSTMREFLKIKTMRALQERTRQRFASKGDDASGPWAPLRWSTEDIRVAKGFAPGPINERTGRMKEFLLRSTPVVALNNEAWFTMPGPADPEMVLKISTAQKGRAKPSTVPRRVIGVNGRDMAQMLIDFNYWVITEIGRSTHG